MSLEKIQGKMIYFLLLFSALIVDIVKKMNENDIERRAARVRDWATRVGKGPVRRDLLFGAIYLMSASLLGWVLGAALQLQQVELWSSGVPKGLVMDCT